MYLINKKIVIRSWLLFIICGQCWANESAVYITFLNIYQSPEPNYYDLDLTFNISLSKKLIKALENSVPLTFEVEVSVHEKRDWLWDKKIKTVKARYLIVYQTLSQKFLLQNLSTGHTNTYPDLTQTLNAMGKAPQFPQVHKKYLQMTQRGYLKAKVSLVLNQLPVAMQAQAYLRPTWQVSSEWYSTPIPQNL
ncbi:MAG TPA: hypothetical protein DCZ03_03845 [Gammaproteobacteria bacterium]|nr:hypothetical protein [Gammaproteobacteria bacterium]